MRLIPIRLSFCGLLLLLASNVQAVMTGGSVINIQFTPANVPAGASWAPGIALTEKGLVAEKDPHGNYATDVWIQSQPIPIAEGWTRFPAGVSFTLTINGEGLFFSDLKGFFRYSSDGKHWSTWYAVVGPGSESPWSPNPWTGKLSLPRIAREGYEKAMQEYSKKDPAWDDDERKLCSWIQEQQPHFFEHEFPFVGYLQIRLEGIAKEMELQSITVNTWVSVSGLHQLKKKNYPPPVHFPQK